VRSGSRRKDPRRPPRPTGTQACGEASAASAASTCSVASGARRGDVASLSPCAGDQAMARRPRRPASAAVVAPVERIPVPVCPRQRRGCGMPAGFDGDRREPTGIRRPDVVDRVRTDVEVSRGWYNTSSSSSSSSPSSVATGEAATVRFLLGIENNPQYRSCHSGGIARSYPTSDTKCYVLSKICQERPARGRTPGWRPGSAISK